MIQPPRLAQRLLSVRLARDERDELIGDLHEQFMRRAASGAASARRWYWGQTLALMWGFAIHRRDLISTSHERTRGHWALANIVFDWRQAARSLRHSPAFALVALLTLVLGIGLSTVVFSMVNGILLQPLPIRDAARVVRLGELAPAEHAMFDGMINAGPAGRIGSKDVSAGVWQSTSTTLAAFAPISTNEVNVTTPAEPMRLVGADVGPTFFVVFPHTPISGRLLTAADDAVTADPVVLITDRFWSDRLGHRADVLDLVIRVADVPTRIVGVVPATLDFLEPGIDVTRPGHFVYPDPGRQRMFSMAMDVVARMKPGVTIETVRALEPTWPVYNVERMDVRLGRTFAQPRFYAVTLVLFASLALMTAVLGLYGVLSYAVERRRREFGVRRALGADERRIVLLVGRRALGLAITGLVIGLAGATIGAQLLRAVLFGVQPLDLASYLAAIAIVLLVVVAASWTPARRARRIDPARALRVD